MGTAGALSLLPTNPSSPILVMNGDILTKMDFKQLLNFHKNFGGAATMCVRKISLKLPFGVARINESRLLEINEKPVQSFTVNAGIYVLEPEVLGLIPYNKYYDMTALFDNLTKRGLKVAAYPVHNYWIDIGNQKGLEKANMDYFDYF